MAFLQNWSAEDVQKISIAGLALFGVLLIFMATTLFVARSRRTVRLCVISSLVCALSLASISAFLYLWHHFGRS